MAEENKETKENRGTKEKDIAVNEVMLEKARELEELKIDNNTHRASKRDLISLEETNRSEIILHKCAGDGGWFEIAENSALIYYYYVCRVLKIKNIKFRDDNDSFFEQYKVGKIAARGTESVRKRLMAVGLYASEYRMNTKLVFVLNKTFSDEQIKKLRKKEVERRINLNKTVEVEHADPLFYRNLSELVKRFHRICSSKLDKLSSQTNGARIVTLVDEMLSIYFHSTDLSASMLDAKIEDWKIIRSKAYRLKYEIQIIDVAELWSQEICLSTFEAAEALIRGASDNLGRLLKKKNDADISNIKRVTNERATKAN